MLLGWFIFREPLVKMSMTRIWLSDFFENLIILPCVHFSHQSNLKCPSLSNTPSKPFATYPLNMKQLSLLFSISMFQTSDYMAFLSGSFIQVSCTLACHVWLYDVITYNLRRKGRNHHLVETPFTQIQHYLYLQIKCNIDPRKPIWNYALEG